MSTYPITIRRCQHIKVNGIQCGSPAVRDERHCFFHEQCRLMSREINMKFTEHGIIKLPTLEDANSIQLGLAEVMRLLVTKQIDHRTASLLLRALRTAAANVKFTSFEPKPTHVVIDPKSVENRPLGATAWSTVEGREYDPVETDDTESDAAKRHDVNNNLRDLNNDKLGTEGPNYEYSIMQLAAGVPHEPNFPDRHQPKPAPAAEIQSGPPVSENREPRTALKSLSQNILLVTPFKPDIQSL